MAKQTNKKVVYCETTNETTAKTYSANNDGSIVFLTTTDGGRIYKGGKEYGDGKGADSKFGATASNTGITVGGLTSGSEIKGKSVLQVLEEMVYPDFAPYFVGATKDISCGLASDGGVLEVGKKTPDTSDYSLSGASAKAYATDSSYVSNGVPVKALSVFENTVNDNGTTDSAFNEKATKAGKFVVRNTVTCPQGTETVISSKGTETRKTGGSSASRVLLASANEDTTNLVLDTNGKPVVKSTSVYKNHTIYYMYRIYASTQSAGVLSQQNLSKETNVYLTLKAGDLVSGQLISVPNAYKNVKIWTQNPTDAKKYDGEDEWTATADTTTRKNGAGETVAYTVYKRVKTNGADLNVLLSFSI